VPGIDIPYKKDSIQATQGAQKGPQSPEDAIGTDPAKERAIIAGIKDLVKTGKDVDLCSVSVPGSNLFCGGNKGIPRKEMPQLKSKPIPGGPADKLVKQGKLQMDDGGEVNTEELFLKSIGKEAKVEKVNVSNLKATQNQIVGKKVSMFLNQLLNGSPDDGFTKALNGAILTNNKTGEERKIKIDGFFVAIGHKPNTQLFKDMIDMDETGYLITKADSTATNIQGIFAAGDVQDKHYRQAVTAAGTGCMAAIESERFLGEQ